MRSLLCFLLLGLLGLVHALPSSGNRLLVVIEDASEKEKYSTFWGDLEGGCTLLHRQQRRTLVNESMAEMHHNSSWISDSVRVP